MATYKINTKNKLAIGIQARIRSKRLYGKVLKKINNYRLLEIIIKRLKKVKNSDIYLLTSEKKENKKLKIFSKKYSIKFIAIGKNEDDVLLRFLKMIKVSNSNAILRICSDNPFVDYRLVNNLIDHYNKKNCDYVCNHVPLKNYHIADGLGAELVKSKTMLSLGNLKSKFHREHVTSYIHKNKKKFKFEYCNFSNNLFYPNIRLDINTLEDFKNLKKFCINEKVLISHSSSTIIKKYINYIFQNFLKKISKKKTIKIKDFSDFFELNLDKKNKKIFFKGKKKLTSFSIKIKPNLKNVFEYFFIINLVKSIKNRKNNYEFDINFNLNLNFKNKKNRFNGFSKKITKIKNEIINNERD